MKSTAHVFELTREAIPRNIDSLVHTFCPGGKWKAKAGGGREYWACSPLRDDKKPDSFSISDSGLFHDFSSRDEGDLIDLLTKKSGISKLDAAKQILEKCGIRPDEPTVKRYAYTDADGQVLYYQVRTDNPDGKKTFSFTCPDGRKELPKLKKRPLYKLPEIIKNPEMPVLLVEGEKCAEVPVDGYIVVTWSGGVSSSNKTDFSPLYGRKVILWPDNDEPGITAMNTIAEELREHGGEVRIITIPAGKPLKWDIADARAEGEDLAGIINQPAPSALKIRSFSSVFEPREPIKWQVENFIRAGAVGIIASDAGKGKTFTCLDLAVCTATGKPWLGRKVKQAPVLIIDEESGLNRLEDRLKMCANGHGAGPDAPIFYMSLQSIDIREPNTEREILNVIRENKIGLVVIDALMEIIPGADENAVKDVLPAFMALSRIAEATGAAFLIIHHTAKQSGQYRGSTAIKGRVDFMVTLGSIGEDKIIIKTDKMRDGEPWQITAKMNFENESFALELVERGETIREISPAKKYVLNYLWENGENKISDIVDAADVCTPGTARKNLFELVKDGLIERTDGGGAGSTAMYNIIESQRFVVQRLINPMQPLIRDILKAQAERKKG